MYARARFLCFYFKCALHPIHFKASYFALFFLLFFLFCIENYKEPNRRALTHTYIYLCKRSLSSTHNTYNTTHKTLTLNDDYDDDENDSATAAKTSATTLIYTYFS